MTPDQITLALSLLALIIALVTMIVVLIQRSKMKKMLSTGTEDLAQSLIDMRQRLSRLETFQRDTAAYLEVLERRVCRSTQATEMIRFTPFTGIGRGGNQSFSVGFLNEEGDGIVVSGLYYSNDRVSLFAKPIKDFESEHELTPEERDVIVRSKKRLTTETTSEAKSE